MSTRLLQFDKSMEVNDELYAKDSCPIVEQLEPLAKIKFVINDGINDTKSFSKALWSILVTLAGICIVLHMSYAVGLAKNSSVNPNKTFLWSTS